MGIAACISQRTFVVLSFALAAGAAASRSSRGTCARRSERKFALSGPGGIEKWPLISATPHAGVAEFRARRLVITALPFGTCIESSRRKFRISRKRGDAKITSLANR
jgi:hypothetical protein